MTAQSAAIVPTIKSPSRGGMFLGFPTVLRKELTEWLRGPEVLIVAGVSIAGAVFMTLIPYIARLTNEAKEPSEPSRLTWIRRRTSCSAGPVRPSP